MNIATTTVVKTPLCRAFSILLLLAGLLTPLNAQNNTADLFSEDLFATEPAETTPDSLFSEPDSTGVFSATTPMATPGTGLSTTAKWVIFGGIGFLIFILQIAMAVFVAMDGKKNRVSGAVGWAIFTAVPLIGFIGLIIYLVMASGAKNKMEMARMLSQMKQNSDQKVSSIESGYKSQLEDLSAQLQSARDNKDADVGIMDDDKTVLYKQDEGRTRLCLTQVGGDRDGHDYYLDLHHPGTGAPKKVSLGRNAKDSDVSFPADTMMSSPHCQISFDYVPQPDGKQAERFYVYDLNSSNGTWIKRGKDPFKRTADKVTLKEHDLIKTGDTHLRVRIDVPMSVEDLSKISDETIDG